MWVYSSAVERLTADQQVPGSNPGAPSFRYPNSPATTVAAVADPCEATAAAGMDVSVDLVK